ncbi:undecaprenyl/decaprenyl-phosphate alpha-N-acetylglucosaminyl 1-phosphate transferase [Streptomyces sp. KLOTTS4A1]|uniref:undecaprenyl/decaprenyl-phosphate alpha-N-acetylglucosaminyl 1-phosphate transferase n=1 Tax=Streptomyces sp. KLOTTS4A1 TaxID=3390996 RepID=UPI0039F5EC70
MLYAVVAAAAAVLLTALLTRLARTCARPAGSPSAGGSPSAAVSPSAAGRPAGTSPWPARTGAGAALRPPASRLGGAAVFAGTLLVSCTGYAGLGPGTERLLWAAAAVALLGLAADLRPGRPFDVRVRLAVAGGAALFVVYGTGLGVLAAAAAVVWIVFVTYAFRWLDRSDGVTGTVGVITALGLALCAAAEGRPGLALVLVVLAASLGGFLGHNWHPARAHLGDCGAHFTGFLLASAAVAVHTGHEALPTVAGLLTLTLAATADTVLVLLSRHRAARPLLRPAPDHVPHRLRRIGFTVPGAAVVLAILTFAGTLTTVLLHTGTASPKAAAPLLLAVIGGGWALLRVPVYGERGRPGGGAGRTAAGGVWGAAGGAGAAAGGVRAPVRGARTAAVRRRAAGVPGGVASAARPADGPRTLALRTKPRGTRSYDTKPHGTQPVPATRRSGTPASGTVVPARTTAPAGAAAAGTARTHPARGERRVRAADLARG